MNIGPILSTLHRHKTTAALIVLEVALTCAIVCNAVHLISRGIDRIQQRSGMAEGELARVRMAGLEVETDPNALTRQDLAVLREVPGVKQVTITNQVPFGDDSWNSGVSLEPTQESSTINVATYMAGENFLATTGLRLVAGRDFTAQEYLDATEVMETNTEPSIPATIINRPMAERLFPDGKILGHTVYIAKTPITVVGVVDELARPNASHPGSYSMLLPLRMAYSKGGTYVLRTDPARGAEVLKAAVAALRKVNSNRVLLDQDSFNDIRAMYFRQDRAMMGLLVSVCVGLLLITALGIVGLASFWVQQRTRMIGIRRALGASRIQILYYFQTENFLLTTAGIVLGMAGAYGINQFLMTQYELPRLPPAYLPIGAVVLWLLGQVAVLGPALRGASVSPVVATRSV